MNSSSLLTSAQSTRFWDFVISERLDSDVFAQLSSALLQSGVRFRFQAVGRSMLPTIEDGEILHVQRVNPRTLSVGDIVLCDSAGLKAHRIVRRRDERFITRGDAAIDLDLEIGRDQILGKVIGKERRAGGNLKQLSGAWDRGHFFWRELKRRLRNGCQA